MKLILAGGGEPHQSLEVDLFFHRFLSQKKILFLPDAVAPEMWTIAEALNWLKSQTVFDDCQIDVWEQLDMSIADILLYDAIYIMGGNTFKLLKVINDNNLPTIFREFLGQEKIIYGISAGAIVMGNSIETAETGPEKDENYLGLTDLSALSYLPNYLIATHYLVESDPELIELSLRLNKKVIGIPETSGLYVDNTECQVIGKDAICIFSEGAKQSIDSSTIFSIQ
jgi:peptidase E